MLLTNFKVHSIKMYVNLSGGNLVDTCGQTDGRTNMKLIGALCDYADAPNRRLMCLRSDAL